MFSKMLKAALTNSDILYQSLKASWNDFCPGQSGLQLWSDFKS